MNQHHATSDKTPNKKGSAFLSGVFLLTLSTMLVKVTGLITKIPLLHLLGAEGMGYYNTAYEVYAFLFVLSTAGLPVALSILISEGRDGEERRRVLRIAVRLFVLLGAAGGGALWLGADMLSVRMGNTGARDCMRAIAPAVFFVCLSSAVRGYYQGLQDMKPTAISQLLEAMGKLVFGLGFASVARQMELPLSCVAAAGAAGLSAGTCLSLLYLLCRLYRDRSREAQGGERRPARGILTRLLRIAVPVTLSSGVITLTRLLDMVLILRRLGMCGYTEAAVNTLYGAYSTLAVPLYSLLPTLIGAVALSLVPGIARSREIGDLEGEWEVVSTSLRLTVLLGLPATMGLSVFARPILELLFHGEDAAIAQAAPLLAVLGASVLSACLMTVTGAMLQAYRRPQVPLYSMLIGAALKLCGAWILLGLPQVGMLGAPLSTLICNSTVVLIDLAVLRRLTPCGEGMGSFCLRTLTAALLSVGSMLGVWRLLCRGGEMPRAVFLTALGLCVVLYLALILRMGVLRAEDVVRLSHGERIWGMLCRLHLVQSGENMVKNPQKQDKFPKTT